MRLQLSCPAGGETDIILVNERMPSHLMTIGPVHCKYALEEHSDYFRFTLETRCNLTLCCQRCMEPFDYSYHNTTCLGLCDNDEVAERLMDKIDPIVLKTDEIPFETIITDEFHLYLPVFHQDEQQCSFEYLGNLFQERLGRKRKNR